MLTKVVDERRCRASCREEDEREETRGHDAKGEDGNSDNLLCCCHCARERDYVVCVDRRYVI